MNLERVLEFLQELGKVQLGDMTRDDILEIEEATGKRVKIIHTDDDYIILE